MTIKEIARLANTSRGTVDRVINKRGKVSEEVEQRVLKIIQETGYIPNENGKLLSLSNRYS
jgi:DNA-binding LacI/PurR family transcriptional regulator